MSGNAKTSQSTQGWAELRVHFIMKCGANISFGPVSFFGTMALTECSDRKSLDEVTALEESDSAAFNF